MSCETQNNYELVTLAACFGANTLAYNTAAIATTNCAIPGLVTPAALIFDTVFASQTSALVPAPFVFAEIQNTGNAAVNVNILGTTGSLLPAVVSVLPGATSTFSADGVAAITVTPFATATTGPVPSPNTVVAYCGNLKALYCVPQCLQVQCRPGTTLRVESCDSELTRNRVTKRLVLEENSRLCVAKSELVTVDTCIPFESANCATSMGPTTLFEAGIVGAPAGIPTISFLQIDNTGQPPYDCGTVVAATVSGAPGTPPVGPFFVPPGSSFILATPETLGLYACCEATGFTETGFTAGCHACNNLKLIYCVPSCQPTCALSGTSLTICSMEDKTDYYGDDDDDY